MSLISSLNENELPALDCPGLDIVFPQILIKVEGKQVEEREAGGKSILRRQRWDLRSEQKDVVNVSPCIFIGHTVQQYARIYTYMLLLRTLAFIIRFAVIVQCHAFDRSNFITVISYKSSCFLLFLTLQIICSTLGLTTG